jgi:hypothetical protein
VFRSHPSRKTQGEITDGVFIQTSYEPLWPAHKTARTSIPPQLQRGILSSNRRRSSLANPRSLEPRLDPWILSFLWLRTTAPWTLLGRESKSGCRFWLETASSANGRICSRCAAVNEDWSLFGSSSFSASAFSRSRPLPRLSETWMSHPSGRLPRADLRAQKSSSRSALLSGMVVGKRLLYLPWHTTLPL